MMRTQETAGPVPAMENRHLLPSNNVPGSMRAIPGSRMFEIKEALAVYRKKNPGVETFDASQGDGGSSLTGVPPEILDTAARMQRDHGTGYDKPYGVDLFRRTLAEEYWRFDSSFGSGPENIIACQGGRDALMKAYEAIQHLGTGRRGDFLLASRVPWISYTWGTYAAGANLLLGPGDPVRGWEITPEAVEESVRAAKAFDGRGVAALIITSPDNPTGRVMEMDTMAALAAKALSAGIPFVLFDWIYHRVGDGQQYDINDLWTRLDPAERSRCIVLDGITKSLGGSNIRNAHLVASRDVIRFIQMRASHGVIPSFFSQAVAIAACRVGFDKAAHPIVGPTSASRKLLLPILQESGLRFITGSGYYAFIDVEETIRAARLEDGAHLGRLLAEEHGIAVVPGVYFSRYASNWIRFSYALPPDTTRRAAERLLSALAAIAEEGR